MYISELTKWGMQDKVDQELVKSMDKVAEAAQVIAFESQLARSLRKDKSLQEAAITKYMALYAKCASDKVCTQLWNAAQTILKGST